LKSELIREWEWELEWELNLKKLWTNGSWNCDSVKIFGRMGMGMGIVKIFRPITHLLTRAL